MTKMFMRFDGGARVTRHIQHPVPPSRSAVQSTASLQTRQQEGKRNAIRKMMNVFEPKKGGGCGSCSGAK